MWQCPSVKRTRKRRKGDAVQIAQGIGPIEGTGIFVVWQRGDGKLKIKIRSKYRFSKPGDIRYFFVPQNGVAWIKKQPANSESDFLLIDPILQKYAHSPSFLPHQ